MPKHKRMVERDDGWSDWIAPVMDGYKMGCCDCGLVHDLQFGVFTAKELGGGYHEIIQDSIKNGRVRFRARRNNRSTAQVRRHKRKADA